MPNAIQSINETREQARKQTSDLCGFDFSAPAELFPSRNKKGRGRITYMRFDTAAEAIRFAVEDMPEFALLGAYLESKKTRFGAGDPRALRQRRLPA